MGRKARRGDPGWPQAVFEETLKELKRVRSGEISGADLLVAWLEDDVANMVYKRHDQPGIYGRRFDTKEDPTGTLWEDSEQIGWEFARFWIKEPQTKAPREYVKKKRIFWIGEATHDPHLPKTVPEARKRAKEMGFGGEQTERSCRG